MPILDPSHELTTEYDPLELPAADEPEWWKWTLSFIVATISVFSVVLVSLAAGTNAFTVAIVTPVIFIITIFLVHAVTERAK
jgi:hypothetical protein